MITAGISISDNSQIIDYNMLIKAPIWNKKSQHKMIELKNLICWKKQEPGQTC